jgi:F420-dependent oxidoreductase-like protein
MRVCLMVEGQEGVTWDEWVALARAAETAELDGLFRSDHYSAIVRPQAGSLDAWATLAALAPLTSRLRLGTMVSPATFRHPSVLARMAVTVDHASGGRVELGMGAGWYEREHRENGFPFLETKTRFELFAEQVEIVVRSWTEEDFDHAGPAYTLRGQTALPRPLQQPHPPLILGGSAKPRGAALAARFAQEYDTTGATLADCRDRRAALDRACTDVGRDPETLPLSLMTQCVLGDDRAELRDRLRRVHELTGDGRNVDESLAARGDSSLVGTLDEVVERLGALERAGVSRVFLQHLDHTDVEAVAAMGRLSRAVA